MIWKYAGIAENESVAAFNQEKALVGAFSVITNLRMELFEALASSLSTSSGSARPLLSPLQSRNLRAAQSASVPQ